MNFGILVIYNHYQHREKGPWLLSSMTTINDTQTSTNYISRRYSNKTKNTRNTNYNNQSRNYIIIQQYKTTPHGSNIYSEDVHKQTEIGWDHFIRGRISKHITQAMNVNCKKH